MKKWRAEIYRDMDSLGFPFREYKTIVFFMPEEGEDNTTYMNSSEYDVAIQKVYEIIENVYAVDKCWWAMDDVCEAEGF